MASSVSNVFVIFARFIKKWLFSPESVAIFVVSLCLFNIFRLFRVLFIAFCKWKYRDQSNKLACSLNNNNSRSSNESGGKHDFRSYCHEARTSDMAAFSLQGRRKTMEDRFNVIKHEYEQNYSAYAVFDGHGGEFAAEYIEDQLFRLMRKEFKSGSFLADKESVKSVLTSIIRTVDAQLVCLSRDRMDLSGSTAIIAIQLGNFLTVANIGDSRCVMSTVDGKVIPLSTDHKPCDPREQKRITEAGGFVTFNGVWRVVGVLATSRAFGDYPLKQRKFVTVEPDFDVVDLSKSQPHFIILASDGLWDVFKNEEAVDFIRARLDEPHFGAKSLSLQAYYRGSLDNITVMVVNLKKKRAAQVKYQRRKEMKEAATPDADPQQLPQTKNQKQSKTNKPSQKHEETQEELELREKGEQGIAKSEERQDNVLDISQILQDQQDEIPHPKTEQSQEKQKQQEQKQGEQQQEQEHERQEQLEQEQRKQKQATTEIKDGSFFEEVDLFSDCENVSKSIESQLLCENTEEDETKTV